MPALSNKGILKQTDPSLDSRLQSFRSPEGRPRAALLISTIVLLAGLSVAPLLPPLVEQWLTVADYDYCFLIAAVCVVWLGRCARTAAWAELKPDIKFLVALALASGIEYVLWQGNSELGAQLLLPPIIWLAIASVTGWKMAKKWVAPVAYFYFAIPIWDQFLPILQQLTIFGAKSAMQMAAIPVTVSGSKVIIAEGTFEVLYGCSGLRYLIVSLALAALVAVMERMSLRRAAVFLAVTVVLAVLANWLRVFIVMYAGHVTGMRHYFVSDNHAGLGHVVFAGLLLTIYWLAQRLRKAAPAQTPPMIVQIEDNGVKSATVHRYTIAVIAVLTVFSVLTVRASWATEDSVSPQLQPLPVALGKWQGPLPSKSSWQPSYDGASDSRQLTYKSSRGSVEVYLNVYGMQRQGSELVFYRNTLYAPGSWQLVDTQFLNALQAGTGMRPLITEQLTKSGERWLVGQLYVVGGFRTASGLLAQMMYGLSTIKRGVPAGVLAFAVSCSADCAMERELLLDFWNEMGDPLVASIPQSMPIQTRL